MLYFAFFPARNQIYGRGEYFTTDPLFAMAFAKTSGMLIMVHIIQATIYFQTHKNYCIVDNPVDKSYTLCLPVLVVSYDPAMQCQIPWVISAPCPVPSVFRRSTSGRQIEGTASEQWTTPFRWHWTTDNGKLEPYSDSINAFLEKMYHYYLQKAFFTVKTPPITRYVDGVRQVYRIDFHFNTQENLRTGYIRNIKRKKMMPRPLISIEWMFYINTNRFPSWKPFDARTQRKIELAYQKYIIGEGPSLIRVPCATDRYEYRINFSAMNQQNLSDLTKREITTVTFSNVMWKFHKEDRTWVSYDHLTEATIEQAKVDMGTGFLGISVRERTVIYYISIP